jgi:ABC-type multidrug transport system fused ATPase/permease subunit
VNVPAVRGRALPRIAAGIRARWLARLIGNGLLQALLAVAAAWLTRQLIDDVLHAANGAGRFQLGATTLAGLLLATLLLAWLRWRETVDAERLAQHYVAQVRLKLFDRLAAMSPRAVERRSQGGVLLRFVGDVQALRAWVGRGIARLLVALGTGSLLLAALAWVAPTLMPAVCALLAATAALMLRHGADLRATIAESRRRYSRIAANMHDKIAWVQVMQAFDQTGRERDRVRRQNRSLRRAMTARAHARGRQRALTQGCIGVMGVLVLGFALWPSGAAPSVGTVVGVVGLVGLLAAPLRDLGRVFEYWSAARVARLRLQEFLDGEQSLSQHQKPKSLEGTARCDLHFEAVGVGGVLDAFSAALPHGRRVALSGAVGSGKSTLLALAARLQDPDGGEVRIGAEALRDLSLASLRRHVSIVSPDLGLLRGTVEGNLRYRCPQATPEQLHRACALSGLDALLGGMPDGLRTRVRDAGRNLSAGQRRAVIIARALLGEPSVLLIDDAEICFDGEGGLRRLGALLRRFEGSVLYVARTPAFAALADEVWQLDAGRLAKVQVSAPAAALRLVPTPGTAPQAGSR